MNIESISIYPVKSLRAIDLEQSVVQKRGLAFDRRFMLVDENGVFISQRTSPLLATIATAIKGNELVFSMNGAADLPIELEPAKADCSGSMQVVVWQSTVEALVVSKASDDWFSSALGIPVHLVYMGDTRRPINGKFDTGSDIVSFADGYPLLILSTKSLDYLNERIEKAVPAERFRSGILVSGGEAFQEDNWKKIRIGDAILRATKPCARCVVTTIDQESGEETGAEPLKTLSEFRQASVVFPGRFSDFDLSANGVLFGMNFVPENVGSIIRRGDGIEIVEYFD